MRVAGIAIALALGLASATAFACPKGTHLVGGTGAHHKGGKCVSAAGANKAADTGTASKHAKHKAKRNAAGSK